MINLRLYQTIHVAHHEARLVAEHAALLDASSRELFGRPFTPDIKKMAAQIVETSSREGYSAEVSTFVRLALKADGGVEYSFEGASLYDGYAFRSLHPTAVSLHYTLPLSAAPTSARESVGQLATQLAINHGAAIAIRCDNEGIFRAADNAPLFGIFGSNVLTACDMPYAEYGLIRRAIAAAGLTLHEKTFGRADLKRTDELFYIDSRGITALSRCDGQPLMTIASERIATVMEQVFLKV